MSLNYFHPLLFSLLWLVARFVVVLMRMDIIYKLNSCTSHSDFFFCICNIFIDFTRQNLPAEFFSSLFWLQDFTIAGIRYLCSVVRSEKIKKPEVLQVGSSGKMTIFSLFPPYLLIPSYF